MMGRTFANRMFSGWDLLLIKLDFFWSSLISRLSLVFQGCRPGCGLQTSGRCYFKARRAGSIRIGKNVTFLAGQRSNRVGLTNPVLLETFGEGQITIGNNSGASAVVISSRSSVSIGNHVKMGGNVRIFDHDYHSLEPNIRRTCADPENVTSRPVLIDDDVFIGTNATILKGVHVGARSIVGAGAVVSLQEISPGSIVAGNPATVVAEGKFK